MNVLDILSATLDSASWTCTATGNAACGNASGTGDSNKLVDITVGDSVEFQLTATVVGSEAEVITNTASLAPQSASTLSSPTKTPSACVDSLEDLDNE